MNQQMNDLPDDEISAKIKFSEISKLMEKIATAKTIVKKIEHLDKFIENFKIFQAKQGTGKKNSIFPILRLFLSHIDRERSSYGIQQSTMGKLYIKMLGISPKSEDAAILMTKNFPYSEIVFSVLRKRFCEVGDNLTVHDVNNKLDSIADSYQNNNRPKIDEILTDLMLKMSAVDQKWFIAIILKEKVLTTKQVLQCYHPKANELYNNFSSLSKVTEIIESGETIDENLTKTVVEPLFHVQSMSCQRLLMHNVDEVLSQNDFYSETKMDGERFQLHIKDGEFKYFSRNGYDHFSQSFGVSRHEGSLSPSIHSLFLSDVQNLILDGEMMIWNKSKQIYHTKGEGVSDVKKLNPNDPTTRPCFVVYDLLFLNDDLLINKPYAERVRLLTKLFREQAGVMVLCERHRITDRDDLLVQFNKAMDNKEEGLVLKTLDSFYKPGVRAGSGWYKMKADYIDGIVSDFDMLIIGGFYNEKGTGQYIESYLLGVYQKTETENKFLAVATVQKGLENERSNLNASLRPHWQKTKSTKVGRKTIYESPPFLDWNDAPPDVWIEPKNSIILEILASELVKTNTYRTNYTFRFPRITNIRSDKQWFDCCSLEEFDGFCTSDTIVQKIDKRHLTIDDLNQPRPAKRTRLLKKTDLLRSPIKAVICKEDIVKLDNLLDGKNVCVMTSGKNYPSIDELENLVLEHGGNIVKNPGPTTFAVIVGDISFRVKTIVNSNKYNFVSIDWLIRALTGGKDNLDEFTPHDMIASKPELLEELRDRFDQFGDSYTEPIDEPRLKTVMAKMTDLPYQLLSSEIHKLEKSLNFQYNIFRMVFGHFFDEENTDSIEQLALRLRGGTVIDSMKKSHQITHVFVNAENLDTQKLRDFLIEYNLTKLKILSKNWIMKSNQLNLCEDEDEFLIKL